MKAYQNKNKSLSEDFNMNHSMNYQLKDSNIMPIKQQFIQKDTSYPALKFISYKTNAESEASLSNFKETEDFQTLNIRSHKTSISPNQKLRIANLKRNSKLEQIDEEQPNFINLNSKDNNNKLKKSGSTTKHRKSFNFKQINNNNSLCFSYINNLSSPELTNSNFSSLNHKSKLKGKLFGHSLDKDKRCTTPQSIITCHTNGNDKDERQYLIDELKDKIKILKQENQQLHRQFLEITSIYSETTKEFAVTKQSLQVRIDSLTKCLMYAKTKIKDLQEIIISLDKQVAKNKQAKLEINGKDKIKYTRKGY